MRVSALLITAALLSVGCGDDNPIDPGGNNTTNQISVRDNFFSPTATTVSASTTVTWTWAGSNQHNVTFDNTNLGASSTITTGTYQKLFSAAGSFGYRCTVHPGMTGTVTVQ